MEQEPVPPTRKELISILVIAIIFFLSFWATFDPIFEDLEKHCQINYTVLNLNKTDPFTVLLNCSLTSAPTSAPSSPGSLNPVYLTAIFWKAITKSIIITIFCTAMTFLSWFYMGLNCILSFLDRLFHCFTLNSTNNSRTRQSPKVILHNVMAMNPQTSFSKPFLFDIKFECFEDIEEEALEWKVFEKDSPESDVPRVRCIRTLDTVLLSRMPIGRHRFTLPVGTLPPSKILNENVVGATVLTLTCSYRNNEFFRIGYYVNNRYTDP